MTSWKWNAEDTKAVKSLIGRTLYAEHDPTRPVGKVYVHLKPDIETPLLSKETVPEKEKNYPGALVKSMTWVSTLVICASLVGIIKLLLDAKSIIHAVIDQDAAFGVPPLDPNGSDLAACMWNERYPETVARRFRFVYPDSPLYVLGDSSPDFDTRWNVTGRAYEFRDCVTMAAASTRIKRVLILYSDRLVLHALPPIPDDAAMLMRVNSETIDPVLVSGDWVRAGGWRERYMTLYTFPNLAVWPSLGLTDVDIENVRRGLVSIVQLRPRITSMLGLWYY